MHQVVASEVILAVRGASCLIEIGKSEAMAVFMGEGAEAVSLASKLVVDDAIHVDYYSVLFVGFPWFVLRQYPLMRPYGLVLVFRLRVVLTVTGIYHHDMLHFAIVVPVVVFEIHLIVKSQASLDYQRVGMLVVSVHVLAVISPIFLCGERSPNVEIHIEDTVALVEEILMKRTDCILIGYFASVEGVVPI